MSDGIKPGTSLTIADKPVAESSEALSSVLKQPICDV